MDVFCYKLQIMVNGESLVTYKVMHLDKYMFPTPLRMSCIMLYRLLLWTIDDQQLYI